jgi:hypothetical protein
MKWKGVLGEHMYIYFEDWSEFLGFIRKDLPHGEKIIKVYASPEHPKSKYGRDDMAVVEVDDTSLRDDEIFCYEGRGEYSGADLEKILDEKRFSDEAKRRIRALFRFDNQENTRFAQEAMATKTPEGDWIIDHPLEDLDGVMEKRTEIVLDGSALHLDIFFAVSLQRLFEVIGYSQEGQIVHPERIISREERKEFHRRSLQKGKEQG